MQSSAGMQRRLAAILMADVAGYSLLVRRDEDATLARLKDVLATVVTPQVAARGGRIVKLLGDGVLASFDSASEALRAALEIQRLMDESAAGTQDDLLFRMGLHVGEVVEVDGDIHGDGVNIACRLEALAEPGGVVLSQSAAEAVRHRPEVTLVDIGERALKNIDAPMRAFAARGRAGKSARQPEVGTSLVFDPPPTKPSIAILPFRYLGSDASHAFLPDGLRLGLQGSLVQLSGMFLMHPFTTNQYRGEGISAEKAAEEMQVRYILEGAVQATSGRARVRLQLTDTREHRVVWAERYDRSLADVFALEDEIVHEVIDALGVKLVAGEATRIVRSLVSNRETLEHFYKALNALYEGSREKNQEARHHFARLMELDPTFVGGPSNLAVTHWLDFICGWSDDPERSLQEAESYARIACGLSPNNGLGHTVLASIKILAHRHEEALQLATYGVAARTSCPMSHSHLASILTFCGRPEEAVARARYALMLEKSFPPWMLNALAVALRDAHEMAEARHVAEFAIAQTPDNAEARLILATVLALMDETAAARAELAKVRIAKPDLTVSGYLTRQPYLDAATSERLASALAASGLPA